MRAFLSLGLLFLLLPALAQAPFPGESADSDHDGLSDALEASLLAQFAPRFMVSDDDCSSRPAQFVPFLDTPQIQIENGTIYGQAFPRQENHGQVELHYYHLWRRDCGEMSHNRDAEHVSALVVPENGSRWRALYWYAAAHEDTLCDASQVARASTVDGELHGPPVWISRGKHASFLSNGICARGCGADDCRAMKPLIVPDLIDVGELPRAMNGATWIGSPEWPLGVKMSRSDFPDARTARLENLPLTTIAWANPDKRRMQAAISGGNSALHGASSGLHATDAAMDLAGSNAANALGSASGNTGNALAKSARAVMNALRATRRRPDKQ